MAQNLELPQVTLGRIGITEFIGVLRLRYASLRMTIRTRSTASRIKSNGDGLRSGGVLIPTLAATAAAKVGHPGFTVTQNYKTKGPSTARARCARCAQDDIQKVQIHVPHTSQLRACMGHPRVTLRCRPLALGGGDFLGAEGIVILNLVDARADAEASHGLGRVGTQQGL